MSLIPTNIVATNRFITNTTGDNAGRVINADKCSAIEISLADPDFQIRFYDGPALVAVWSFATGAAATATFAAIKAYLSTQAV